MQRAAAHEARGYEHAGRGNGRAANAHFERAMQLRSAFGVRRMDEHDRVAAQVVRAYNNARPETGLKTPSRDVDLFAEELRRAFPGGAPACNTHSLELGGDDALLQGATSRWVVRLGVFNGGLTYEFLEAGEMHGAAGNKRRLDESENEPGARKRVGYEYGEAAMES
jgi:hypothetical protein